jgi:hypothetical protein
MRRPPKCLTTLKNPNAWRLDKVQQPGVGAVGFKFQGRQFGQI